jgi:hypothetical protein
MTRRMRGPHGHATALQRPTRHAYGAMHGGHARCCSESLRFVGLAISASLLTSSPRPSCTADSSVAMQVADQLRATAPVRSLEDAWPCSAPQQPFKATAAACPSRSPPCQQRTSLSVHISHFIMGLSCPIPQSPPKFPSPFQTAYALCPFCCLSTGFECIPLLRLPFWRYRWNHLILYLPKSSKALQSDMCYFLLHVSCIIRKLIRSTYRHQNKLSCVTAAAHVKATTPAATAGATAMRP